MIFWKHGRYIDLWSVVHFLSGATLALGCHYLGLSFLTAVLISALALCAWEFFEWITGIIEPSVNVAFDLGVGAIGFLFAAYWQYFLENGTNLLFLGTCLLGVLGLSFWGFLDFYFRGYR